MKTINDAMKPIYDVQLLTNSQSPSTPSEMGTYDNYQAAVYRAVKLLNEWNNAKTVTISKVWLTQHEDTFKKHYEVVKTYTVEKV